MCFSAGLLLVPLSTRAQTAGGDNRASAALLFDQAQAALAASNVEEACTKLEASQRLDAQLGTLLHLSACYERLGRVASAWSGWREAADWAVQRKDEREKIARKHAQELEPKVPRLTLRVSGTAPAGLQAKRDGAEVAPALFGSAVPVDPGKHHIEVTAPGYRMLERDVTLAEGGREVVEIALAPDAEPSPIAVTAPITPVALGPDTSAPTADKASAGLQRPLGLALGGLGVVALGVGTYFAFDSKSTLRDRDDVCPSRKGCTVAEGKKNDELTEDARKAARFANIGLVGGAVLAAAGVTLWLTAPSEPKATPGPSASFSPWATTTGAGCAFQGAF